MHTTPRWNSNSAKAARRIAGRIPWQSIGVIALLGFVVAILFPVPCVGPQKARQATCSSNEKRISQALLAYAADYDETYPLASAPQPGGGKLPWGDAVADYLPGSSSGPQSLACPEQLRWREQNGLPSRPAARVPYAANPRVMVPAGTKPMRLAQVREPAKKLVMGEVSTADTLMALPDWDHNGSPFRDVAWFGHNGRAVLAFCDGHVKALRPTQTQQQTPPSNMWGGFDGTAGPCANRGINCDAFDPQLQTRLEEAEARYPRDSSR